MSRLSDEDTESIFLWAEKLTGTCQTTSYRREVLAMNVERRMFELGIKSFDVYLKKVESDPVEKTEFVSRLTIHTTSWFRESPHYDILKNALIEWKPTEQNARFVAWSVASSTGEEGYGMGLILETHRRTHPGFEYEIFFTDVDAISVEKGRRALYSSIDLERIPKEYHFLMRVGSGKSEGWMTLDPEIRKRSKFGLNDLSRMPSSVIGKPADFVMCRNVLIYFGEESVKKIVESLFTMVSPVGILCFGHSEALEKAPEGFESIGHASYARSSSSKPLALRKSFVSVQLPEPKKRVLVIDDSELIRKVITKLLEKNEVEVVEAESAPAAREILKTQVFDVITLDLHMPEEDGSVWLEDQRRKGLTTPVLIVTNADSKEAAAVIKALEVGAQGYFLKHDLSKEPERLFELVNGLIKKKSGPKSTMKLQTSIDRPEVIVIGASTGGPEALCTILKDLPQDCPPVLVVQHINKVFTKPFAERVSKVAQIPLGSDMIGSVLENGKIYMAQDQYHIGIKKTDHTLRLDLNSQDPLFGHMPAVDYLFRSVANQKIKALAILLTGMGKDGAQALYDIKCLTQSYCVIQDEESSIVYGMPKEAASLGAFHFQGNLESIKKVISLACGKNSKASKVA